MFGTDRRPFEEEKKEEHPSYGTVQFSRVSGGNSKLFGSKMKNHQHYIELVIRKAHVRHELSRDWIFGRDELIAVKLSSAQFAELLTSMNVGSGIPCTIDHIQGERMPPPPDNSQTEVEKVRDGIEAEARAFSDKLRELTDDAKSLLLAKGSISVKSRKHVADLLDAVHREVASDAPYRIASFQRAMTKITVSAKAEVDALLTHVVQIAGFKALRDGAQIALQLGTTNTVDDDDK